jgi:hypothetical protein
MLHHHKQRPYTYICRGRDSCRPSLAFCRHTESASRGSGNLLSAYCRNRPTHSARPFFSTFGGRLFGASNPPRAVRHQQTPSAFRDDEMSPKLVKKKKSTSRCAKSTWRRLSQSQPGCPGHSLVFSARRLKLGRLILPFRFAPELEVQSITRLSKYLPSDRPVPPRKDSSGPRLWTVEGAWRDNDRQSRKSVHLHADKLTQTIHAGTSRRHSLSNHRKWQGTNRYRNSNSTRGDYDES